MTAHSRGFKLPTFRQIRKNRLAISTVKLYNRNNLFGNGGGEEMKRSIFARLQWLEALTIYRAIFHLVSFKGGESVLFSKLHIDFER